MQETLKDLNAQKQEHFETKDNDVTSDFEYRSAIREIDLNVKVSFNYFLIKKFVKCILTNYFMNKNNMMSTNITDISLILVFLLLCLVYIK